MSEVNIASSSLSNSWASIFKGKLGTYSFIIYLGILLFAMDIFIISTVLPLIITDIGGAGVYSWATMLYTVGGIIGGACGFPLRSALGGRRAYFVAGTLFLIGTIGVSMAPTMSILLVARIIKGLGGGLITATSYTYISELYPENLRPRFFSGISLVFTFAAIIGPAVGGTFAEMNFWRGAFWFPLPFIIFFIAMTWRHIPATTPEKKFTHIPYIRLLLLTAGILVISLASQLHLIGLENSSSKQLFQLLIFCRGKKIETVVRSRKRKSAIEKVVLKRSFLNQLNAVAKRGL